MTKRTAQQALLDDRAKAIKAHEAVQKRYRLASARMAVASAQAAKADHDANELDKSIGRIDEALIALGFVPPTEDA